MTLENEDTVYDRDGAEAISLFNDDYALTLAAGEVHNKFVGDLLDGLPEDFGPQEFAYGVIRAGCARGAFSHKAEKALRKTVAAVDLKAKDLGLSELERMRKASINEEAEFVVIAIQQITAASIRNGLDELAIEGGGDTQAKRRRLWKIGLLDLAGGGAGFLVGGIGGAIAGAIAASAGAAAVD